jgi:hypothetical protein
MAVTSFGFISPLSASRDLSEGLDDPHRLQLVLYLLMNPKYLHQHAADVSEGSEDTGVGEWYDKPQGSLIERLSMFAPDDELFDYTARGHYEGMAPIEQYFGNLVPHFLNPNKGGPYGGNFYAHEMGYGLAEDDYSTGISFSPVAEAYHCEGWGGIFWLLPAIWVLVFSSADFVAGDMVKYPWGLLLVVYFAHAAPEQLVGGMIYFLGYVNAGMLFAIVVVTRIAPILGALFIGKQTSPPSRRVMRTRPVLSQVEG